MFHVATMLPFQEKDAQKVERKRHIGNDVVVLIFKDRTDENDHFDPTILTSHFNSTLLVYTSLLVVFIEYFILAASLTKLITSRFSNSIIILMHNKIYLIVHKTYITFSRRFLCCQSTAFVKRRAWRIHSECPQQIWDHGLSAIFWREDSIFPCWKNQRIHRFPPLKKYPICFYLCIFHPCFPFLWLMFC